MNDYEKKRRDECIHLRRLREVDKGRIEELLQKVEAAECRLDDARRENEVLRARLATWEAAAKAFGQNDGVT